MVRDLEYPEDARRVIDALHASLRYDAAIAVLGLAAQKTELPAEGPDFSVGIRASGRSADEAVRRDAPGLLSRFSLISMIGRIDDCCQQLLLQRRVLESLGAEGKRMDPETMWGILQSVTAESRQGIVALSSELVVETPSPALMDRMEWLQGLVRVRNCLAHRNGHVQIQDVRPAGASLRDTKDTDTLNVSWLRVKSSLNGLEIKNFPAGGGGHLNVDFEDDKREWRIGQQIEITPLDCQGIALSLSLLGNQLLADFEHEMNSALGLNDA